MPIFVKASLRGKSIVKAYVRAAASGDAGRAAGLHRLLAKKYNRGLKMLPKPQQINRLHPMGKQPFIRTKFAKRLGMS